MTIKQQTRINFYQIMEINRANHVQNIDKIFNKWKPESLSKQNKNTARDIIFIICLGTVYILLQGSSGNNLAGWGAIHLDKSLSPMSLSFIFGTLFLILKFSDYKIRFLSSLVLLISTLLHPFIGISIFVIGLIFYLPLIKTKKEYLTVFATLVVVSGFFCFDSFLFNFFLLSQLYL